MSRITGKVRNRQANPVQITAEQLLREAWERQEAEYIPPKQEIHDLQELGEYQMRKRKEFEDLIRRAKHSISHWLKYATWEESQGEMERARSIFNRALDVHSRVKALWIRYAEMEIRHKNVNRARNIWDRAVALLPRIDDFWLKYSYMEQVLGNYPAARQVFERWMQFQPEEKAWLTYINFEKKHNEFVRAREIFTKFVKCHNNPSTWLKYAKFEIRGGRFEEARKVFEEAIQALGEHCDAKLYIEFAKTEIHLKEHERARAIYKYALDHIPKHKAQELYQEYISFEKQFGGIDSIEEAVYNRSRMRYEDRVKAEPYDYDAWFNYVRLEESAGDANKIRDLYERAIAQKPTNNDKKYWRRYIYFWINYALYEELGAEDINRTREVYKQMIEAIPHRKFSFSKVWILFSQFEIRQHKLEDARKILGRAIGEKPKDKIFEFYIDLESKLGNVDRCRTLYERWLEIFPHSCQAWCKYAELETSLKEIERARALYGLAIEQSTLDMPELVWKSFIDFEIDNEKPENARNLYESLLTRTKHVKVWLSYAQFEESLGEADESDEEEEEKEIDLEQKQAAQTKARAVYERAYRALNGEDVKDERVALIEAWHEFEKRCGDTEHLRRIEKLLPQKIKRKRPLKAIDGTDMGWEEYFDYVFPDEQSQAPTLKILQLAHKWKKTKADNNNSQ